MRIFHPYVTSLLYVTNVLLTWQEIVAYYGGMLGLCIGFSIVGFMEVVYFSTYRFVRNLFWPPTETTIGSDDNGGLPSYKEVEQVLLANRLRASRVADQMKHNQMDVRQLK